jgi:hypothetical protein
VTLARARPEPGGLAAVLGGSLVGFITAVDLARLVRPALLTDPDPGWAWARLLLGLGVAAAAGAAAAAAAGSFFLWSRSWLTLVPPRRFRSPEGGVGLLAAWRSAGVFLRSVWLASFRSRSSKTR